MAELPTSWDIETAFGGICEITSEGIIDRADGNVSPENIKGEFDAEAEREEDVDCVENDDEDENDIVFLSVSLSSPKKMTTTCKMSVIHT
jgi:hypothetical protein